MSKQTYRVSVFVFAFLTAIFFTTVPGTGAAFRNVKEGAPAIPFTLKDFEGKDVEFKPAPGKVAVLSFVDLSQERSRDQIKDLVALHSDLGSKGADFFLITKYTNTPDEAKKTASELGVKFPILLDKDQKAYGDYGLYILPATGVIGKDGKFAFDHSSHGRDFKDVVGGKIKVILGLLKEDDYKRQITPVESVHKSKEESAGERELALGRTLLKRGMPDKAIEKFAKVVELDPKNLDGRLAYGEALVSAKKYDDALVQFQKAKELAPQSKDVQIGLGTVQLEKGETDKAIETLAEASMLNPKPAKAYFWLGAAYEKKGDLPNAVKFYRKSLEKLLKD